MLIIYCGDRPLSVTMVRTPDLILNKLVWAMSHRTEWGNVPLHGTNDIAYINSKKMFCPFFFQPRSKGDELYKKVNTHLNLDEPEFFGLLFIDEHDNQVNETFPCFHFDI